MYFARAFSGRANPLLIFQVFDDLPIQRVREKSGLRPLGENAVSARMAEVAVGVDNVLNLLGAAVQRFDIRKNRVGARFDPGIHDRQPVGFDNIGGDPSAELSRPSPSQSRNEARESGRAPLRAFWFLAAGTVTAREDQAGGDQDADNAVSAPRSNWPAISAAQPSRSSPPWPMSSAITRGTPGDQDIFDRMLHSQRTGSSEKGQEPAFPDGHGEQPRRLLGPQHQKLFQEKTRHPGTDGALPPDRRLPHLQVERHQKVGRPAGQAFRGQRPGRLHFHRHSEPFALQREV